MTKFKLNFKAAASAVALAAGVVAMLPINPQKSPASLPAANETGAAYANKAPKFAQVSTFTLQSTFDSDPNQAFDYYAAIPRFSVLSQEEINAILARNGRLHKDVGKLISSALSLTGKVNYFWGGKSRTVGWDPKWGQIRKVTSKGDETTGTMRPFGLDCSGFVKWCFIQLGYSSSKADKVVGNGTWRQWPKSKAISWNELRPGDFVFQNEYPTKLGNHIGICIGYDENGEPAFVHCAYSLNGVYVTHADDIFKYARRPKPFVKLKY